MSNFQIAEDVLDIKFYQHAEVVDNIKKLLADLQIQYHNLRNFHWNVTGHHFYTLHEKFEELYNDIAAKVDETAERILALGSKPGISLRAYEEHSSIEDGSNLSDANEMVQAIISGNETLIADVNKILRVAAENDDEGTIDTFTSYLTELQKTNWMLKAFLG